MPANTFLVTILISGGVTPNRAAAFERVLDDHPIVGLSGQGLAQTIQTAFVNEQRLLLATLAETQVALGNARDRLESANEQYKLPWE